MWRAVASVFENLTESDPRSITRASFSSCSRKSTSKCAQKYCLLEKMSPSLSLSHLFLSLIVQRSIRKKLRNWVKKGRKQKKLKIRRRYLL